MNVSFTWNNRVAQIYKLMFSCREHKKNVNASIFYEKLKQIVYEIVRHAENVHFWPWCTRLFDRDAFLTLPGWGMVRSDKALSPTTLGEIVLEKPWTLTSASSKSCRDPRDAALRGDCRNRGRCGHKNEILHLGNFWVHHCGKFNKAWKFSEDSPGGRLKFLSVSTM